ncbi:helix-turn-helix domain-containing protein [Flavivirga spongiicola]|uniref:Helix-turn-helix domain-containing protein n=1 Tax=Flavivirga spongiicola TaxID=421621 RepID=A0ABU7XSE0_9FLAO|nr:helix-turn-helix transcriptional regulator [Flavivirga sp. MEBiC05379]MDO5978698.1 helix-turn-helix transcriptional regulator [Flavivirga sp. MEBiC05379]
MKDDQLLFFKTSIILVLKELRRQKNVSQADVNTDILEKTGFSHNMGRNEVDGNFTMETLHIYCKYFNISVVDFFKKVDKIGSKEIQKFLKQKEARKNSK